MDGVQPLWPHADGELLETGVVEVVVADGDRLVEVVHGVVDPVRHEDGFSHLLQS